MTYSKKEFANDLEAIISKSLGPIDCDKIGNWACDARFYNICDIDPDVEEWLVELGAMSMGPEFALDESELREYISKANA